ncbi:MAG: tetraacyldisaccharide 4'-kinase [Myxococcales bacterium]|nr:tetraacyldisaccharide 4'-kinase [Myxococcales bacterium]
MFRREVGRALERGALRGPTALALSRVWARFADPVRPVSLPSGVHVIGVGGATLGGSGKTPVVLALARALSPRVAVVATPYGAALGSARRVRADDRVEVVGDEALWLARALGDVPVIVGKNRSEAIALAATHAPCVIVDGLLQARPVRVGCSLLVLDADAPWGAERCPPAGDLRAGRQRVLAAADAVVTTGRVGAPIPVFQFDTGVDGAIGPGGERVSLGSLGGLRLGLVLAIARPERVLGQLSALGICPAVVELHADHARIPPRRAPVDAWVTSAKCATKLGSHRGGVPVWVLEHRVVLPSGLVALASPPTS